MKKGLIFIVVLSSFFVLTGCSKLPALEKVFTWSEAEANKKLFNVRREKILKAWGQPDSMLSGFYGDIYLNPGDTNRMIVIYYDGNTETVTDVKFSDRQVTEDNSQFNIGYDVSDIPWYYTAQEDRGTDSDDLTKLREHYPEYFDFPTDKGLEVYIWQMAPESYSFGVLAGTNREKTIEELWNMKGVSAAQMRAILSTYDIDPENIVIIPYQNPISSYLCEYFIAEINESEESVQSRRQAYIHNIRAMLFTEN